MECGGRGEDRLLFFGAARRNLVVWLGAKKGGPLSRHSAPDRREAAGGSQHPPGHRDALSADGAPAPQGGERRRLCPRRFPSLLLAGTRYTRSNRMTQQGPNPGSWLGPIFFQGCKKCNYYAPVAGILG